MDKPCDRILNVAAELFYAEGLRATGVDTIIAKAGVAKATFYKHYPTKDDLVLAFLERRDRDWRGWLEERVEALSPAPAGKPLAIFDALGERFARGDYRGCAFINSIVELARRDHAVHQASDAHKRAVTAYVEGLLVPLSPKIDPAVLAAQIVMLMDGAIVTAMRQGDTAAAPLARQTAAALLAAAGLAISPPGAPADA